MNHLIKLILLCSLVLTGCASVQESTQIRQDVVAKGVVLTRALPTPLPSGAVAIPESQFIIINADSAALELVDMLNPVPFLTDAVKGQIQQRAAADYKARYAQVAPFTIASERLAGSTLLSTRSDAFPLMPLVYMVESSDDRWRLSLSFRIEGPGWLGRYIYPLPTIYSGDEIKAANPSTLETLRNELVAGSDLLRQLLERDARGELKGDGTRVEFGSYYVVGSNLSGVIPANLVRFPNAELLEEGSDYVVLRSRGDWNSDAVSGALAFGVHYFRKDQLHDFKKTQAKAN